MPNSARWHGFADYKGYLSSSFKGMSQVCHLGRPRYARSTLFISLPLWQTWQQVALSMIGLRSSPCLYQTSIKPLWCCQVYEDSDTFMFYFFVFEHPVTTVCMRFIYVCTKETSLWFETLLLFVLTGFVLGLLSFLRALSELNGFLLLSRYGHQLRLLRFLGIMLQK